MLSPTRLSRSNRWKCMRFFVAAAPLRIANPFNPKHSCIQGFGQGVNIEWGRSLLVLLRATSVGWVICVPPGETRLWIFIFNFKLEKKPLLPKKKTTPESLQGPLSKAIPYIPENMQMMTGYGFTLVFNARYMQKLTSNVAIASKLQDTRGYFRS